MRILVLLICLISSSFSLLYPEKTNLTKTEQDKVIKIEEFLSTMTTLHASTRMQISQNSSNNIPGEFIGKIWLDRTKKMLRIDYSSGNAKTNKIIAKNGMLAILEEGGDLQEFSSDDTPAGILLKPSIKFNQDGINVTHLTEQQGVLILSIAYCSPIGDIPITLYFKEKPFMLLMGWTIQNPNGTITQIYLDPDNTSMAMPLEESIFN